MQVLPQFRHWATARVAPTFHAGLTSISPLGDRQGRPYISWRSYLNFATGRPPGSPLHFMQVLPQFHQPLTCLLKHLVTFAESEADIAMSDMRMFWTVKGLWRNACHTDVFCQIARKFQRRP